MKELPRMLSPIEAMDTPEELARTLSRFMRPGTEKKARSAYMLVGKLIFAIADSKSEVRAIRSDRYGLVLIRKRHAIAWVANKAFAIGPYRIARAMNRDHSTILHSVRVASRLRKTDKDFRTMCDEIEDAARK